MQSVENADVRLQEISNTQAPHSRMCAERKLAAMTDTSADAKAKISRIKMQTPLRSADSRSTSKKSKAKKLSFFHMINSRQRSKLNMTRTNLLRSEDSADVSK